MENRTKEKFEGEVINMIFVASFLVVIIGAFVRYYYLKEYAFTIETSCNSIFEWCYERDCTNPDDCPPNGLSNYKQYTIQASKFDACQADNCEGFCSQANNCYEIVCNEEQDSCTGLR